MARFLSAENPMILGWDMAGTVAGAGTGVTEFATGDEVFGSVGFPGARSAYAQFSAAPANQLARKPDNLSHIEAPTATQSPLTAWQALVDTGLGPRDRVLIHGAAGGVGSCAVQIARHIGCRAIANASSCCRPTKKRRPTKRQRRTVSGTTGTS